MDPVLAMRTRFRELICENQFDLPNQLDDYNPSLHKGVYCRYCSHTHVVEKQHWKALLAEVNSSSLTNKEKNEFIHCSLSSGVLREAYIEEIEAHETWSREYPYWFAQQELLIDQFEKSVLADEPVVRDALPLKDLTLVTLRTANHRVAVPTTLVNSFLHSLDMKRQYSHLTKTMPSIVLAHLEAMIDQRAQKYVTSWSAEEAENYEYLIDEFYAELKKNEVDLPAELHRFVPSFNAVYVNPKTDEAHLVLTHVAQSVKDQLFPASLKHRLKFLERVKQTEKNVFDYCLPYVQNRLEWPKAIQIMNRFSELHAAFVEQVHQSALSAGPTATRFIYCFQHDKKTKHYVDEQVYQKFVAAFYYADESAELLTPDFVLSFNLVKAFIRDLIHSDLVTLNKIFLGAKEREGIRNYNYAAEHVVSVSQVTDEQLKEFYECGRKVKYETGVEAYIAAIILGGKVESTIYSCLYCEGYHYGVKALREHTAEAVMQDAREWYLYDAFRANKFMLTQRTAGLQPA